MGQSDLNLFIVSDQSECELMISTTRCWEAPDSLMLNKHVATGLEVRPASSCSGCAERMRRGSKREAKRGILNCIQREDIVQLCYRSWEERGLVRPMNMLWLARLCRSIPVKYRYWLEGSAW